MTSTSEALLPMLLKEYIDLINSASVIKSFRHGDGTDSLLDETSSKRHASDHDDEIDEMELEIIASKSVGHNHGYVDGDNLSTPRRKRSTKKASVLFFY